MTNPCNPLKYKENNGGERGIRTLGGLAPTTVFETAPFNHSGTSPRDVPQPIGALAEGPGADMRIIYLICRFEATVLKVKCAIVSGCAGIASRQAKNRPVPYRGRRACSRRALSSVMASVLAPLPSPQAGGLYSCGIRQTRDVCHHAGTARAVTMKRCGYEPDSVLPDPICAQSGTQLG